MNNPTGKDFFASPTPSSEILNDLRIWVSGIGGARLVPGVIILPLLALWFINILFNPFGLPLAMYIILLVLLFLTLREAGLVLAVSPSWISSTGLLLVLVIPVSMVLVYGFPLWVLTDSRSVYNLEWGSINVIGMFATCLILAILKAVLSALALRLMDARRQGEWD